MTFMHIINYTLPIAFMVFMGYYVDRICKPDPSTEEIKE